MGSECESDDEVLGFSVVAVPVFDPDACTTQVAAKYCTYHSPTGRAKMRRQRASKAARRRRQAQKQQAARAARHDAACHAQENGAFHSDDRRPFGGSIHHSRTGTRNAGNTRKARNGCALAGAGHACPGTLSISIVSTEFPLERERPLVYRAGLPDAAVEGVDFPGDIMASVHLDGVWMLKAPFHFSTGRDGLLRVACKVAADASFPQRHRAAEATRIKPDVRYRI